MFFIGKLIEANRNVWAKRVLLLSVCTALLVLLEGCTYLKHAYIQHEYARIQSSEPSQLNVKHLLGQETFFVYGKVIDQYDLYRDASLVIAAYSNQFDKIERVDSMFMTSSGTHYGLNLPPGKYTLMAYVDKNEDGFFAPSEVVGAQDLVLSLQSAKQRVLGHVNVHLTENVQVAWAETITMPERVGAKQSLFYPSGTIRGLDDAIFDEKVATLGMYDPASFLEIAPTMFYALEEDLGYKIPVVFVHGIGGSSRSFESIVKHLDTDRYKPWFFYYPSGGDLDQFADFFYQIFLSGEVIPLGKMPMIVVAHSMGGLVVREAINSYKGSAGENQLKLLVTIASPLGGHPAAADGEDHGLIVLPAWRDLNPESQFIKNLYRKPLPEFLNHQLFYAYQNTSTLKLGENSDGVVPLSTQLYALAQAQATGQFGFNSTHVGVLEDREMIASLLGQINQVESFFPDSQLKFFLQGGFDVALSGDYSAVNQYLIRSIGKFLVLLANGVIEPLDSTQRHFVQSAQGKIAADSDLEKAFLQFARDYPALARQRSF